MIIQPATLPQEKSDARLRRSMPLDASNLTAYERSEKKNELGHQSDRSVSFMQQPLEAHSRRRDYDPSLELS
jgi:hypothetical protein